MGVPDRWMRSGDRVQEVMLVLRASASPTSDLVYKGASLGMAMQSARHRQGLTVDTP